MGTARKAAGMKYVNSARFITARPPRTLSLLIANAAPVAISRVMTPDATAMRSEFQSWSQKWLRK
jgi:hypothetical protein